MVLRLTLAAAALAVCNGMVMGFKTTFGGTSIGQKTTVAEYMIKDVLCVTNHPIPAKLCVLRLSTHEPCSLAIKFPARIPFSPLAVPSRPLLHSRTLRACSSTRRSEAPPW